MKRFKRRILLTLGSLGIAALFYAVYALIIVPEFLGRPQAPGPGTVPHASNGTSSDSSSGSPESGSSEGEPGVLDAHAAGPASNVLNRYKDFLLALFPDPNDWRHSEANLIVPKENVGMLLFKGDPKILAGGRTIRLDSCTIIILGGNDTMPLPERWRRALVLETSENATLYFTKPLLQYSNPDFSAFERGELNGQVVIRSDMDSPESDDNLLLQTRNITFNTTQILANNEVIFQLGRQNGDGEGLTMELDMPPLSMKDSQEKTPDATLQTAPPESMDPLREATAGGNVAAGISITRIELKQLNRLQFPLPEDYLNSFGDNSQAPNTPARKESEATGSPASEAMVDVRCKQGFYFAPNPEEVAGWVGRFMGDVEVLVLKTDAKHDCLKCKNLYLYFLDPTLESLLQSQPNDPRILMRKKRPTGRLNKLEAVKLKAVRTEESPATVEVPLYNFNAEADELIYDLRSRSVTLQAVQSGQKVLLKKDNITVAGEGVSWSSGGDDSFGTIIAGRNGTFDATMEDKGQVRRFHASWKDGLKISPEPGTPGLLRFSALGGVTFRLDGLGTIRAEEADFWGAVDRSATTNATSSASNESPTSESSLFSSASAITPYSAQFRGNIHLETNSGEGDIKRELTIRFQTEHTSSEPGTENARTGQAANVVSGEPESNNDSSSLFGDSVDGSRYVLTGDNVDLWMVRSVNNFRPSHILINGNVRFNEKNATEPDSLRIEGDKVRIVEPFSNATFVDLVGENARFAGKGLQLTGYHVTVNKAENSFAVLGPGRLSLAPKEGTITPENAAFFSNDPIEILWSKQMYFNGQTLFFQAQNGQDVTVSQKTNRITCPEIRVSLKRPVSIFELKGDNNATLASELDVIECVGSMDRKVQVEFFTMGRTNPDGTPNLSPDAGSNNAGSSNIDVGVYRAAVEKFLFKYDTFDFAGQGPGWIRVTMKMPENSASPVPVAASAEAPTGTQSLLGGDSFGKNPWKQLHLTFQESITGNIREKVVRINNQVESVFCASLQQDYPLDVTRPEDFPEDAVSLNCEKLQINQTQLPESGGNLELAAFGNVLFRYKAIVGRSESLKYVDAKKTVWLEGDNTTPASLFKKEHPTAPSVSLGRFMRGSYNLNTEKIEVENYSNTIGGGGF